MAFKQFKRSLFLLLSFCIINSQADLKDGPPPDGESILLIYTSATDYGRDLGEVFKAALTSFTPSATFEEVIIPLGDGSGPGIYDELVAQTGETSLSKWCQVYDLRFREDKNNQGWTGQAQEDVITYIGTNTDWELFSNYLDMGGSLFLQGEHHDFYIRNSNLIMFINSVALNPISQTTADIIMNDFEVIDDFTATVENFNTDFNNLGGQNLLGGYPGGIKVANVGSGKPITTMSSGSIAMALAYLPEDLKTDMGRMVVSFESNAFNRDDADQNTIYEWIQNVYDLLSGCYRYDLEKTFEPDTGKLGEDGTFKINYQNNGGQALHGFTVRDTIPSCLEFISSTPAPSGNSGNAYWWNLSDVAVGASGEIVVRFKSVQMPPCN